MLTKVNPHLDMRRRRCINDVHRVPACTAVQPRDGETCVVGPIVPLNTNGIVGVEDVVNPRILHLRTLGRVVR